MADDYLSLRGFAQVVPRTNTGNLFALTQLKQRQDALAAEAAAKRQKEYADDFKASVKLGELPVLGAKMTESLVKARGTFLKNMESIYQDGVRNGFTPEHRRTAMEMRNSYQNAEDQAEAFNYDLKQLGTTIKDLEPILDLSKTADAYKKLQDNTFIDEKDGTVTFNKKSIVELRDLLNNPEIYNPLAMADLVNKKLGTISKDIYDPQANISDQVKFDNVFMLHETGPKKGTPILDKNTGRPLVNTSPEAINFWNSQGEMYEKSLKNYADKNFGGDVQKAFGNLMEGVADYSSTKTKINSPYYGAGAQLPNPQLSTAQTFSTNSLKEAQESGVAGYKGSELDLQWIPDAQRRVRVQKDGKDIDVEFTKFGIGANGEKGLWGTKMDAKGKYNESVFIPIKGEKDPNLQILFNSKLPAQTRAQLVQNYQEFNRSPVVKQKLDQGALDNVVSDITQRFQKTDNRWPTDIDVSESITSYLNDLGVENIRERTSLGTLKEKPLDVKADVANWFGSHKVTINNKVFDLDEEKDIEKLKSLIYENSDKSNFLIDENNLISPEDFNSKWASLKSGESLVGPDGKTYTKQ